jgi:hypothetical protein
LSIEFRDADTEALVRQLAAKLGVGPEEAIEIAVRRELARLAEVGALADPAPAKDQEAPAIDKDAFTELNEDG